MMDSAVVPASARTPQIDVRGVHKTYGSTRALIDVTMTVAAGEARALLGRNGAGKSTLMAMLTATQRPDQGSVNIAGEPAGSARSVACVYQHSRLVPALSVAENIVFGHFPRKGHRIDWSRVSAQAERHLAPWGLSHLSSRPVQNLDLVQAKIVEICRALAQDPRVLLLDEPTAGLDRRDGERLFEFVERLKARHVTLVYVSHHMDEIFRLCDSATVLRDAHHVLTSPLAGLSKQDLVEAMVGTANAEAFSRLEKAPANRAPSTAAEVAGAYVEVRGLAVAGAVEGFDIDVRQGECVGIAGLDGSGKTEIGEALAGLIRPDEGTISVDKQSHRLGDVRSAINAGIGYVPQSRHARGMVSILSVSENATMTATRRLAKRVVPGLPKILLPSSRRHAFESLRDTWRIKVSSSDQPISELSGGNQQKCVMARALATSPKLLVLHNPTAGVDVAAKASIMETLNDILSTGSSVIIISEDVDDFILASRILVISHGRISQQLTLGWTDKELTIAMQGA